MQADKSYPPEVQALREQCQTLIRQTAARFAPPDPATATATAVGAYDTSPEVCARRVRAYQQAIDPYVRELAKLEVHAIVRMTVPAARIAAR